MRTHYSNSNSTSTRNEKRNRNRATLRGLSREEQSKALSDKFDELFVKVPITPEERRERNIPDDVTHEFLAHVCAVCDQFVRPEDVRSCCMSILAHPENLALLRPHEIYQLDQKIIDYYKIKGKYKCKVTVKEGKKKVKIPAEVDLSELMLSPRTQVKHVPRNGPSLLTCKYCHTCLTKHTSPKFAISNGFFFGTPPEEIRVLNDVELAFLSPVKSMGYFFAYTGDGFQKAVKGCMSFYKIDPKSIVTAVEQFKAADMRDALVVVLYGKMTPYQKERAKKRTCLRTDKIIAAMEWLIQNHAMWKTMAIDLDEIRAGLQNPVIIDNSTLVENAISESDNNVERTDTFKIWFPDQSVNCIDGGCESAQSFQEQVTRMKLSGYTFECSADFQRRAVYEDKDDNLMKACLMQFPFGRGGMDERHRDSQGGFEGDMNIIHYIRSLSRNSQQHFHHELFALVMYNLYQKQVMLESACFRMRNKRSAAYVSTHMSLHDVGQVVDMRQRHMQTSNMPGQDFIGAIDALAGNVPHTNEATNKARRNAEAMNHHFGHATYFLTINPDDNNSFLVQVYANSIIDGIDVDTGQLTTEYIQEHCQKRIALRLKCPGICAWVFELLMDIVKKEVIGWGKNSDNEGIFGKCQAWTQTIEEQGRRSLHSHFQIWIPEVNKRRDEIDDPSKKVANQAKSFLCKEIDKVISTSMFWDKKDINPIDAALKDIFPHECEADGPKGKSMLEVVEEQGLRNLRHRQGKNTDTVYFAKCKHCDKTWHIDELVSDYLVQGLNVAGLTKFPTTPSERLKSMAIDYQKGLNTEIPYYVVECAYNVHYHVPKTCFKKRRKDRPPDDECRMRYPKNKRRKTCVEATGDEPIPWYNYDGSHILKICHEILVRRSEWDAFQNQSCPSVGHSKLTCNTNLSMMLPGLVASYIAKYVMKDTQDDDKREYKSVLRRLREILGRDDRRHENDFSEAVSRVISAALVHQSNNVVGASLASYLTRNGTRFHFSHDFVWCPLRDMQLILDDEQMRFTLRTNHREARIHCPAFDYLCRPRELEHLCMFDFFTWYIAQDSTRKNTKSKETLHFVNTDTFDHPSYDEQHAQFKRHLTKRKMPLLVKIVQYSFPDTAAFNGSIRDDNIPINHVMENYSYLALLLFHPFRSRSDLVIDGSFTKKFRDEIRDGGSIQPEHERFLQNIQDSKANCFRYLRNEDDLQRVTQMLNVKQDQQVFDDDEGSSSEEEEDIDEKARRNEERVRQLLEHMTDVDSVNENARTNATQRIPTKINLYAIRERGSNMAGYENLSPDATSLNENIIDNVQTATVVDSEGNPVVVTQTQQDEDSVPIPAASQRSTTKSMLVATLRLTRRRRRYGSDDDSAEDSYPVANGSPSSLREFAKTDGLDEPQTTAFEVIMANFLLTYYNEAIRERHVDGSRSDRHEFEQNRRKLELLARKGQMARNENLIALLHGPGGSGKSRVISLVLRYAQRFCDNMEVEFNSRTIVVCAYSGVAATILKGETLHSALYLNNEKITNEMLERFVGTRMVIIDEISFASDSNLIKIDKHMRLLRDEPGKRYGGVHMVFAGDYRQLEPVRGTPIYKSDKIRIREFVNVYLELNGMHRFKEDPEWGRILKKFRDGTITLDDINIVNRNHHQSQLELPEGVHIACHKNQDRDAKNAAAFHRHALATHQADGNTKDSIMVFASKMRVRNFDGAWVPCTTPNVVYQNCAEDDFDYSNKKDGRLDPVLKLTVGAPVMITTNLSVVNGIANGTRAFVKKVHLRPNAEIFNVKLGLDPTTVTGVFAHDVLFIDLEHKDTTIHPQVFSVEAQDHTVQAKIPVGPDRRLSTKQREDVGMKMHQFPVISDHATTVHKLQGCTVDAIFIHSWNYAKNWVYVALSRVKTRQGLFLNERLSTDLSKYKISDDLKKMLSYFERTFTPEELTAEENSFIYS